MKVALIIGHNEKSKGAYSEYLKISEFDFYSKVIDKMFELYRTRFNVDASYMKQIKEHVTIFRVPNTGYSKEMQVVVDKINKDKFDVAVELHFNAGGGSGTTVLYWHKSSNGKKLADLFQNTMNAETGIKKRELIQIKGADQNGAYGIMNSKCPYVLLEPFFGDSADDCKKVSDDIIAEVLFKYLNIITNVQVSSSPEPSTTMKSIEEIESAIRTIATEIAKIKSSL